jgi:hypothetical protein
MTSFHTISGFRIALLRTGSTSVIHEVQISQACIMADYWEVYVELHVDPDLGLSSG